ncbi:unnamed protein product [Rhodiola kirilowii]
MNSEEHSSSSQGYNPELAGNSSSSQGNNPELAGICDVLKGLTAVLEKQNGNDRAHDTDATDDKVEQRIKFLREFKKMNPPVFTGTVDPDVADKWIKQVKKLLDLLAIPDDCRVVLTSHLFEGEADYWWDFVKSSHDVASMTWEVFEEVFFAKYFRESARDAKMEEFIHLLQRNMTVAQYESKFAELSRFALSLVATEQMRAKRFERGLRPSIQEKLVALRLRTYVDVVKVHLWWNIS